MKSLDLGLGGYAVGPLGFSSLGCAVRILAIWAWGLGFRVCDSEGLGIEMMNCVELQCHVFRAYVKIRTILIIRCEMGILHDSTIQARRGRGGYSSEVLTHRPLSSSFLGITF